MDREKVIKGLECCTSFDSVDQTCMACPFENDCVEKQRNTQLLHDALALLQEHGARELTMDEWREWKNNPKRNPICKLWENDTSPMWILNPNDVHEPALLMGKLKLFTGKPTFEQCRAVKWG